MSFGFKIINDYGNISIMDSTPNYIIMKGGRSAIPGSHVSTAGYAYTYYDGYVDIGVTFVYLNPVRSYAPPLLYVKSRNNLAKPLTTLLYRVHNVGAPGNWQGMVVNARCIWDFGANYPILDVLNTMFPKFAICAAGSNAISLSTHGIRLRDENGVVTFDSGNNQLQPIGINGEWQYTDRDEITGGQYLENWIINGPPLGADEWILCSFCGSGAFTRYNGETAYAWFVIPADEATQVYGRKVQTGRSGTDLYWPAWTMTQTIKANNGTEIIFADS